MNREQQEILESNIDRTMVDKTGSYRKPRSIAGYEFSYLWNNEPSFGASIYQSIIKGFSSVFEYEGIPEEIDSAVMEAHLLQSGRLKFIKVGSKHYVVHVVPKKFTYQGEWKETSIIEPWLPGLTGKTTEMFNAVEMKNDVLGQSIIRLIFPFIEAIDDAFFNLDNNQKVLAGKWLLLQSEANAKTGDNNEDENAWNQYMINGKPVKKVEVGIIDGLNSPLIKLEVDDATQSFISTIQFNMNQMLNVLGIPNNNVEGKKERMITGELSVQNILQSSILEDMINQREKFVEEINRVHGLGISVKIKEGVQQEEVDTQNGGDNNEPQ